MATAMRILFFAGLSLAGVVPLMSLTEFAGWFRWTGWIVELVELYRQLLYPMYDYAAALVDKQLPGWGKDYVSSSSTFYAAYSKVVKKYYGRHWFSIWRERLGDDEFAAYLLLPVALFCFILAMPVAYMGTMIIGPLDDDSRLRDGGAKLNVRLYLLGYLLLEIITLFVFSLFGAK